MMRNAYLNRKKSFIVLAALAAAVLAMGLMYQLVSAAPLIFAVKTDSLARLAGDVDGDSVADPGDTLEYEVVVGNLGITDATNARFLDIVDFHTTYFTDVADPPDLQVRKVDHGFEAEPGDTIRYTMRFTNTATATATGVVLTDTVPSNTTYNAAESTSLWNCPSTDAGTICTLPVGTLQGNFSSGSVTFAVDVHDSVHSSVNYIVNAVEIGDDGSNGPDRNPGDNFSSAITPLDASTDLQVRKVDHGFEAEPGDTIVYTMRYTNTGTNTATGVTLTDTVPSGTTFNADMSTIGWNCPFPDAGTTCTFDVGTMPGNFSSGSVAFVVDVLDPLHSSFNFIVNAVAIGDDGAGGPDQNPGDNFGTAVTPVDARTDLQVRKVDHGFEAEPGDTIHYTMRYTNTGTNTANSVVLTDTVPSGTTFNADMSTIGWNCPFPDAGTTCTFDVGTMPGNFSSGSVTFVVDVISPADATPEYIVNAVAIGDDGAGGPDQNPGDNFGTAITPLEAAPDLQISKDDGLDFVPPGGAIQYTIVYTNVGNRNSDSTIISETVPAHTTFDSGNNPAGFVCTPAAGPAGANCTVDVGTVAGGGGGGSVTFAVTVDSPLTSGATETTNYVDIDGTAVAPDANPADNSAEHATIINAPPEIEISLASQTVQYSDRITTVTITGTDPGPDLLTLNSSSLPANLSVNVNQACDDTNGVMVCTWTLEGQMLEPVGSYDVVFTATDGTLFSEPMTTTIDVLHEDATVAFDPANEISQQVDPLDGLSGMFSLAVLVKETIPDLPAGSNLPGDISKAVVTMSLVPVGPGNTIHGICNPDTTNVSGSAYSDELLVTCDFDDIPVNVYSVEVDVVGNYYTGSGEDVLVVYDPDLGFTTGGGWFYWPGSEDVASGYPGDKTNFGYTMKYNKKGQRVKGSLLVIRHLPDGSIYRLKSNSLDGLALGESADFGWASFTGKATFMEPGSDPIGNHEFLIYVEDYGQPGAGVDRFWIQVLDKDDNLVSELSMDEPALDKAELLEGGNILVPHQPKGKGNQ